MVTVSEKSSTPTSIRIPEELSQWLKHQAVDNYRSFNGEVIHRLQQSRNQQESQQPPQQGVTA